MKIDLKKTNAPVNTVIPNAKETPTNPIPISGIPAAKTAAPQPPRTSHIVPINSANNFFMISISFWLIIK